jgi:hypothetical protein
MEKKGKAKLYMQSVPHKCKVCNHVCHRAGTQFPHDECVHPHPSIASAVAKEKTFEATGINYIGVVVDGPFNTMG